MGVATVELHVNTTNTIVGATVVDAISGLSGTTFDFTYDLNLANTTRYYWIVVTDDGGNETTQALGAYTTDDTTAPTITVGTQARGTPGSTSIDLTFAATDNDPAGVQAIYLYQSTSATAPDAAAVKAFGVAKARTDTSHTFTGLTPDTEYFAWILARDPSSNETAVTAFAPASITTVADTMPPVISGFSISAGTDPETQVSIIATIADSA